LPRISDRDQDSKTANWTSTQLVYRLRQAFAPDSTDQIVAGEGQGLVED